MSPVLTHSCSSLSSYIYNFVLSGWSIKVLSQWWWLQMKCRRTLLCCLMQAEGWWSSIERFYQIISIHITRPTYKHILYQAIGKLSGTICCIDELIAYNEISVDWQTEKSQVSCPFWWSCLGAYWWWMPPYFTFIYFVHLPPCCHLQKCIYSNGFTQKPQLAINVSWYSWYAKPCQQAALQLLPWHICAKNAINPQELQTKIVSFDSFNLQCFAAAILWQACIAFWIWNTSIVWSWSTAFGKKSLKPTQASFSTMACNLFDDHTSCLCFLVQQWCASDCDVKAWLTFVEKK